MQIRLKIQNFVVFTRVKYAECLFSFSLMVITIEFLAKFRVKAHTNTDSEFCVNSVYMQK
jgi:hypothetical protein